MCLVHSFTTHTAVARGLVQIRINALKRKLRCVSRQQLQEEHAKRRATAQEFRVLHIVRQWWQWAKVTRAEKLQEDTGTSPQLRVSTIQKMVALAKRVKAKAAKWTSIRYVSKELRFLVWRIPLPSRAMVRGRGHTEVSSAKENRVLQSSVAANSDTMRIVRRFQMHVIDQHLRRRRIRLIEFEAWLRDCKHYRWILTAINAAFLGVLASFTMVICVLLSAAFTDDLCMAWGKAVGQSILMQTLVTGPLLGSTVLGFKLLASWILLRSRKAVRSPWWLMRDLLHGRCGTI